MSHVPSSFHPPHAEGVAQPLASHVAAAVGHLGVTLVSSQHLVQEVDVPGGQFERLDLTEFVRRQGGDDLPQLGERVVQRLSSLSLSDIGEDSLVLEVFHAEDLFFNLLSAAWA